MFIILQCLKILLIIFLIFICILIKLITTKDLKQTSKKIRIWLYLLLLKKNNEYQSIFDQVKFTEISRIRQRIESFFNSIKNKSKIQNASKIRSSAGLIVHIFGKIAACLLITLLNFWLKFIILVKSAFFLVFFWISIRSLRQCDEIKFFLLPLCWTTIYSFYNW